MDPCRDADGEKTGEFAATLTLAVSFRATNLQITPAAVVALLFATIEREYLKTPCRDLDEFHEAARRATDVPLAEPGRAEFTYCPAKDENYNATVPSLAAAYDGIAKKDDHENPS